MSLRAKLILLGLLPLLVVAAIFSLVTLHQGQELAKRELDTFEQNLMRSKETALRDYVTVMRKAAEQIRRHADSDAEARERVKALMQASHFSDDGYFFAYSKEGVNLVHAVQPELIGQDLIDMQDANGDFLIRNLLRIAAQGGGYHKYLWRKPSTGEVVDKISYVEELPDWEWMFGTGLYFDDVALELQQLKAGVDANVRQTLLSILVALMLAVGIVVSAAIWFNVQEHRLADQNLKELSHKTVQHQEEVRRRVSRELHDGINQLLVSVKYRLETALSRIPETEIGARESLVKGGEVLNSAIQEVRRISHDLRPSVLDDLGLLAALNQLLNEYEERTGIRVQAEIQPPREELSEEVATTLYRIVQETLSNVEKHAKARHLMVDLEEDAEGLYLSIADDGVGIVRNRAFAQRGIGLRNMRERVEFLGGEFNLESEPGQGTRVSACFRSYQM